MAEDAKFVQMVLTCGSWQEAHELAEHLLEKRLVACVEMLEIKSRYWWKHRLEDANEIKLIMESVADNFAGVEAELKNIHTYDTFVLQAVPITQLSADASAWLAQTTDTEGK
jgi:periplasmic divalent cation tolerance protein